MTLMRPANLGEFPFVQARWFTPANRNKPQDFSWIVVHDMEAPERPETAENTANFFATTSRKASVHFNVDGNSAVRSVHDKDVAYGAGAANRRGLHMEHAGYAKQQTLEWLDPYGVEMLNISATISAAWCQQWAIPAHFVDHTGLRAGERGITTHHEVSQAFGGTHWDPGPNFPMAYYIDLVNSCLQVRKPPPPPSVQEETQMLYSPYNKAGTRQPQGVGLKGNAIVLMNKARFQDREVVKFGPYEILKMPFLKDEAAFALTDKNPENEQLPEEQVDVVTLVESTGRFNRHSILWKKPA